ncbi:MAG: hypothetical protein SOZ59_13450 [Candidatus Limivivens sp.]|nr:hypothetical protein [Candidatus Limivivens sp.]
MINTSGKYKIKTDTVLKNFWRDNARFADLFNTVLFDGENVIKPEALEEADTDLSAILKIGSHTETLQKILDVVKKSAYGVDFVILGLENQQHIHFGMPLRLMVGDALGYLKEYEEIAKKNKEEGHWDSTEEFLSGFRREDRLHPMVTICVYYGEKVWDGPFSLTDMLSIPEKLKPIVNDYKMNLIQVRESEQLRFQNPDVQTVFDVSRNIFKKNYGKIEDIYREQEIDSELGLVIGTITESKELINHALERKGGRMNMCTALEELKNEGKIVGFIEASKGFGATREEVEKKIRETYGLDSEEAAAYMEKYW